MPEYNSSTNEPSADIRKMADEVLAMVEAIVRGELLPHSPEVQARALSIDDRIGPLSDVHDRVLLAVSDCLVDILTCDGATWDTPMHGFQEHLEALRTVMDRMGS